jgi:hypothetical protein
MITDFNLLTIITIAAVIFTPIFIRVRSGMAKRVKLGKHAFRLYTRNKILQISFGLFFGVIISLILGLVLFFAIKQRDNGLLFDSSEMYLLFSFIIVCFLVAYGAGSYVAAIVIEQCMLKPDEDQPKRYKALHLYNEFFHGPFSHVLMYSGIDALFLILCILEKNHPLLSFDLIDSAYYYYLIYGVILGIAYYYWQLWNGTWKHQLPWFMLIFSSQIFFIYYNKIDFATHPFNLFFFTFQLVLNTGIITKFIFYRRRRLFYRYNLKFDQLFK